MKGRGGFYAARLKGGEILRMVRTGDYVSWGQDRL